jgi:hypothetical protein
MHRAPSVARQDGTPPDIRRGEEEPIMRRWIITTIATAAVGFIVKRFSERGEQPTGRRRSSRR